MEVAKMNQSFRTCATRITFVALMAAIAVSSTAYAQVPEPWVAGPSISPVGTNVAVNGGNFVPGTVVLIRTAAQRTGVTTTSALSVGPSGTITHAFTPGEEGSYSLAVIDDQGKELASANLNIVR